VRKVSGLVLAAFALGCGGGSSVSPAPGPSSPLAGFYAGPGTASNTKDEIDASVGVSADGTFCGTLSDNIAQTRTLLGGLVSDTGAITDGTIEVLGTKGKNLGSGTLTGRISNTSAGSGQFNLALTATLNSATVTYSFTSVTTLTPAVIHSRRRRRHTRLDRMRKHKASQVIP
jgi:hypothetical protein